MRTLKWLMRQMETHKDAVVIIGPHATEGVMKLDESRYNRRNLKRNSQDLWEYYKENIDRETSDAFVYFFVDILKEKGLVTKVIDQNLNSPINGVKLSGDVNLFRCDKCKTIYSKESIDFESEDLNECEVCNGKIRPDVLLCGEKYSQENIDEFIDAIKNTHTVFMIGVDFDEDAVSNALIAYGEDKEKTNTNDESNMKIAVSVQNDLSIDSNQILFCEFKVEGNIDESLKRFIENAF